MKKFSLLSVISIVLLSACTQESDLIVSPELETTPIQSLAKKTSTDKGKVVFSNIKKNYSYKTPILELNLQSNITLTNSPKGPMIDFMKKFVTTSDVGDYEIFSKIVQGKVESVTLTVYQGNSNFIKETLFPDVYNYVGKTCEIFQSYMTDYSSGKAVSNSFYPER